MIDPIKVTVDNFARAETHRMFSSLADTAGGANRLYHYRAPMPIDRQAVIRANRDTLYSSAIMDISAGATVTVPDAGGRYVSVMVVNEDHYINRIIHEPGEHRLTVAEFDTPYVLVAARILVDPEDPGDIAAVNALQDGLGVQSGAARPFEPTVFDEASLDSTRATLLELARGLGGFERSFGAKDDVDPVRHLIGAAAAWGGMPEQEALYLNVDPGLPVGAYQVTVRDVPVDAFWSVSVYNATGYFEPNDEGAYSVNSITADPNADGSITVHFGGPDDGRPNRLPIVDGWSYFVRMYRPRPEVLDGSWAFPKATSVS